MKNEKRLGNDGLTEEFYISFFNEISPLLIYALNHYYQLGQLSTSQWQALITLIEKKTTKGISNPGDQFFNKRRCHISILTTCRKDKKVLANIIK